MNNISRRDYFAAMAMQGMLASERPDWHMANDDDLARKAVDIADLMITTLTTPQQDNEPKRLDADTICTVADGRELHRHFDLQIADHAIAAAFELVATHPHIRTHTAAIAVRCALLDAAKEIREQHANP